MSTLKKYVVYLTRYNGELLPRWYIGSSVEERILKGYNGSVTSKKWITIYKQEQQENKHLFKTRILSYHETRKEALYEELRVQKMHQVRNNNKYFNESYASKNGYFGHTDLKPNLGKLKYNNGEVTKFFYKGEQSKEFKLGLLSDNVFAKGTIWVNDGILSKMVKPDVIPVGFVKGRTKFVKPPISEKHKNSITKTLASKMWIYKGKKLLHILKTDFEMFSEDGWKKGKPNQVHVKGRKWVNKDTVYKMVYESEIELFLSSGWKKGRK